MKKVIVTLTALALAACSHAATARLLSSTPVDFGAISTTVILTSFNITVNASTGAVTYSNTAQVRLGGVRGTLYVGTVGNSAANIFVRPRAISNVSLSLIGCTGLLSSASISAPTVDVASTATGTNFKTSPALFNVGGTLSFFSVIGSPQCRLADCVQDAFCVKADSAPANDEDCHFKAQLCYSILFTGTSMAVAHRAGASLRFGSACPSGTSGTVNVTAAGVATAAGGAGCFSAAGAGADIFDTQGSANTPYFVTFPQTSFDISNGTTNLTVDSFTSSCPSGAGCTVGSSGTGSFTVGGRLTIPANAPSGTYSGYYTVTVNY